MTSCIHASLILLPLLGQVCTGGFKYCQEAVDNVKSVTSCPTSEKEWESAANRKNCQLTAAQQTCSEPETFLYHCVINGYGNETLEVCAPRRLMTGYCTEFNVAGGVIQSHLTAPCNKSTVLRCDDVYYSTHAHKYPDCYDIVYKKHTTSSTTIEMPNKTTISDQSKNRNTEILVAVVAALVIVIIAITSIGVILLKRRKTKMPNIVEIPEMESMIPYFGDTLAVFQNFKYQEKVIEEKNEDSCTPGPPVASVSGIHSDSVDLQWAKSEEKVNYYQIRYKKKDGIDKWNFVDTDTDQSKITITGLMANTKYVFQVRSVYQDQEGQYGPESNDVLTAESASTSLLNFSKQVSNGIPPKYQLFVEEVENSRNIDAQTKQVILGEFEQIECEKTIMLVGATGSGKSTLVDGIVNYVMGVNFDDPFRFTLIQLEKEEDKNDNQAVSQTEWITVYKIMPRDGSRLTYTLNIIDTPGFGDSRGIDRDQVTIDHIQQLFSETGAKGVLFLDAVCFIVKAPDARLTFSQKYIFNSMMSLFGKNIESNICTLITFADGGEPPVLDSLKEANIPFGSTFKFNNSALFAENKKSASTPLSQMFWDMGCTSFRKFFDEINHFETRSISQSKAVLQERDQLKNIIAGILPQVRAGLTKLSELRAHLDLFKKRINDIEKNKDFENEVEETHQIIVKLDPGHRATNCLNCNLTCHVDCGILDDDGIINCIAMKDGYCAICSDKCNWNVHKNTPYKFDFVIKKVKKTYTEMKKKYEEAKGLKLTHEFFIKELLLDVKCIFLGVTERMMKMELCKSRLKKIALRPDHLSTVEHLELMIQVEKHEKQPGYTRRIEMLYEFINMAEVEKDCNHFCANYNSTKQEALSYGLSSNTDEKFDSAINRFLCSFLR